MFNFLNTKFDHDNTAFITSKLYDQQNFYKALERDIRRAKSLVVIESPFITTKRLSALLPALQILRVNDVRVVINTKPFEEHDQLFYEQSVQAVEVLQGIGVKVLLTVGHHRKVAIIDDDILWEGSLNILSQNYSCEIMRRIKSPAAVSQMMRFTDAHRWC